MVRFAMLVKFTEKGITAIKDSPARAAAFQAAAAKVGATVEAQYWLLGEYDGLVILSAPDDQAATALALALGSKGNVRTGLCQCFNEAEFKSILSKM